MKKLDIKTTTTVILNGLDIQSVLNEAANLAHEVLEELSIYRQRNNLDPFEFNCEGSCCKFLDLIGD